MRGVGWTRRRERSRGASDARARSDLEDRGTLRGPDSVLSSTRRREQLLQLGARSAVRLRLHQSYGEDPPVVGVVRWALFFVAVILAPACGGSPDVCSFQTDRDGDGYPARSPGDRLVASANGQCPAGSYPSGTLSDCDDNNPAVHPEAVESECGIDLDCDSFFDPCPPPRFAPAPTTPQI